MVKFMLHSYAFSNFQSFRERTEVDLTLSRKTALTDWMGTAPTGERVSKLMAVIGPNGSGKTALLKPMAFMAWFIGQSFQQPPDATIPVAPHFMAPNDPTEFEAVVDFDDKLWRYVLRLTPERVLHEALYLKRERFGYVFMRDWDAESRSYVVKQQDFGLPAQEARKVRPNVSFISWRPSLGFPWRCAWRPRPSSPRECAGPDAHGRASHAGRCAHFSDHPDQQQRMDQLLTTWDLGLSGVELREVPLNNPQEPSQTVWMPFCKHRSHGAEFRLPFALESSGTQGAFVLLARLLEALENGGLAVIDEFENGLHPHMLEPILDLFANPATNPHQAQLLFTCTPWRC